MNKKILLIVVILILLTALTLWISGIIPKQIAKISATHYLKKNFPKIQLEYVDIEWASSFGGYSIKFKDENGKTYGFIMNSKYFPIRLGQGMFAFEEEYREKYIESDNKMSAFKGLELYVWKKGDNYEFGILMGTNRTKTVEEINELKHNPQNIESIKNYLDTYENDTYVFVIPADKNISEEELKTIKQELLEMTNCIIN